MLYLRHKSNTGIALLKMEEENKIISFVGYHGTDSKNTSNIQKEGFRLSLGDNEWLGDGVYFFIEGLHKKPQEQATKWASCEAWDKEKHEYTYDELAVLECNIQVEKDKLLDLTCSDGIELLEYIRDKHAEKIKKIAKKKGTEIVYLDGALINFANKSLNLGIQVSKGNFYIKFEIERKKKYNQRTANATICSVVNPSENIKKCKHVLTKKVPYETD